MHRNFLMGLGGPIRLPARALLHSTNAATNALFTDRNACLHGIFQARIRLVTSYSTNSLNLLHPLRRIAKIEDEGQQAGQEEEGKDEDCGRGF